MKNLIKMLSVTAICTFAGLMSATAADEVRLINDKELRVLVNPIYPPMEFVNPDTGLMDGFDVDLAHAIAGKLGLEPIFIATAFADIPNALQTGRGDMILSGMSDTVQRQEAMDFIDYITSGPIFFTLAQNAGDYQSNLDVCGKKVAASRSTTFPQNVERFSDEHCIPQGKPAIEVHGAADSNAGRLGMKQGRYDVVVQGIETIAWQMNLEPDTYVMIGDPIINDEIYGMAFKKDNPGLRDKVASILDELIADGTYGSLLEKWGLPHNAVEKAVINGAK